MSPALLLTLLLVVVAVVAVVGPRPPPPALAGFAPGPRADRGRARAWAGEGWWCR